MCLHPDKYMHTLSRTTYVDTWSYARHWTCTTSTCTHTNTYYSHTTHTCTAMHRFHNMHILTYTRNTTHTHNTAHTHNTTHTYTHNTTHTYCHAPLFICTRLKWHSQSTHRWTIIINKRVMLWSSWHYCLGNCKTTDIHVSSFYTFLNWSGILSEMQNVRFHGWLSVLLAFIVTWSATNIARNC